MENLWFVVFSLAIFVNTSFGVICYVGNSYDADVVPEKLMDCKMCMKEVRRYSSKSGSVQMIIYNGYRCSPVLSIRGAGTTAQTTYSCSAYYFTTRPYENSQTPQVQDDAWNCSDSKVVNRCDSDDAAGRRAVCSCCLDYCNDADLQCGTDIGNLSPVDRAMATTDDASFGVKRFKCYFGVTYDTSVPITLKMCKMCLKDVRRYSDTSIKSLMTNYSGYDCSSTYSSQAVPSPMLAWGKGATARQVYTCSGYYMSTANYRDGEPDEDYRVFKCSPGQTVNQCHDGASKTGSMAVCSCCADNCNGASLDCGGQMANAETTVKPIKFVAFFIVTFSSLYILF